jgi:hypothetical protein
MLIPPKTILVFSNFYSQKKITQLCVDHRVLVPGHWLIDHEQFFPKHFARVEHAAVV